MRLEQHSIEYLDGTQKPLQIIERASRTCYKSEDKITDDSASQFVAGLLKRGHEAMIEHAYVSYKIICGRGESHEYVRHRLFSFAQESTRYCNYKGGVTFITPTWERDEDWLEDLEAIEQMYLKRLECGWKPQQAREILPTCTKTEIVITGDLREWRHFFKLRTDKAAHPNARYVAILLLNDIRNRVPVVFDDIEVEV